MGETPPALSGFLETEQKHKQGMNVQPLGVEVAGKQSLLELPERLQSCVLNFIPGGPTLDY